jgi:hypothetical protein
VETQDIVLVLVVVTALAFDFTNGFHDTANAMATSIATRALKPKVAVALAALLNFVGAFISLKVAATIAEDIVDAEAITTTIILAGLLGGIFWNRPHVAAEHELEDLRAIRDPLTPPELPRRPGLELAAAFLPAIAEPRRGRVVIRGEAT